MELLRRDTCFNARKMSKKKQKKVANSNKKKSKTKAKDKRKKPKKRQLVASYAPLFTA
jgi:hypothetical protein